ncbi:hypothetical protein D9613_012495 [Agrocybe pediades]|uniref:Carboxylic ester hydrolase n=1 Tax=Agrocybe pediades TaxID=84607 RepID=A0A8H4QQS5_9AGAR|nr:hypothetical protein D9613_012495 [Agrocybe pediades]
MLQGVLFLLLNACCGLSALAPPSPFIEVSLQTGVFRGEITPNGTDRFRGIPFALPPVGNLRFKAPVPITKRSNTVQDALAFSDACPQPPNPAMLGADVGEDCLHLNVWRPHGVKAGDSLPVLLWFPGGAYTVNAASNPQYDPTGIIQRSLKIGKPIVFVSANYRLNTFGFLASASVPAEDLNMGLHDERLAMQFVQDNIASFGGDPKKVTIWGQSAGAGSVEAHFLYPTKKRLFRAGIADSSVGPFKNSPDAATFDKPGKPFDRLLQLTGCNAAAEKVGCLQKVPFDTLLNISNAMVTATLNHQLWQPAVGPPGSIVPERASKVIASGNFLHLPYIGGTNLNEGTFFTTTLRKLGLSGDAETEAFKAFINGLVIDNSTLTSDVIDKLVSFYPANDPSLGAPFNTGDSLFDRAAAWYTDQNFLAVRRSFFQRASSLQPMFAYHFAEFIPGNDIAAGVTHQSELELIFGPVPAVAAVENPLSTMMRDFYINLVNDLNPGPGWPAYTLESPQVLQLTRDNVTIISDNWNVEQTTFMSSERVLNEFQK